MIKRLIICLFLIIVSFDLVNAQKETVRVIYTPGIPSVCSVGRVYVNVATGFVYTYKTGVGCFLVSFSGGTFTTPMRGPDGTGGAPTYSFSGDPDTGMFTEGSNTVSFTFGGVRSFGLANGFVRLNAGSVLTWANSTDPHGTADTILVRDGAANTLALRNAANAQTFRVYNTYTDASNYERLSIDVNGGNFRLVTQNAGTGVNKELQFQGSGIRFYPLGTSTASWIMNSSGHITPITPNTYDLCNTTNTCRTGYFGTNVFVQGATANDYTSLSSTTVTGQSNSAGIKFQLVTSGATVRLASDGVVAFNNGTSLASGSLDTGIARVSAGVVKVTDGGAGNGTSCSNCSISITAFNSTAITINTATWTTVALNSEDHDDKTFHDNATNNSRITIPTGITRCVFNLSAEFTVTTGGTVIGVRLIKNGVTASPIKRGMTVINSDASTPQLNVPISVTAGDYYEMQVYQDTGSNKDVTAGLLGNNFSATCR